jgi:predicted AAA+ superfamily ATPase
VERDAYQTLLDWKCSPRRKPLLLRGARQVGKTWLLKRFGEREYSEIVYLNFEEDPRLAGLFAGSLSPDEVIRNLGLYLGRRLTPGPDTLFIFDEVQACAPALTSLEYFLEEAPEAHVAAAGSLLDLRVGRATSFPVGKVELVDLQPMSFLEFLDAVGESGLREMIDARADLQPLPEPLHDKLIALLKTYYFMGGMPEAVMCHTGGGSTDAVRKIQNDILRCYHFDFVKYAAPHDIPRLSLVWASIPLHLARENKKFVYAAVQPGARAREYENAIAWLVDAGLVHKALRVSTVRRPLQAVASTSVFKLYALDVGLLCAMAHLSASTLVDGDRLFSEFRGSLTESYVAQQLMAQGVPGLHYWASPGGRAELDFLVEREGDIYPLEVKAVINPRSKSLQSFDKRVSPPALCRTNLLNMRRDGRFDNYPLYAVSRFPALSSLERATSPRS